MTAPLSLPLARATDANGTILPGALLDVFLTGTTTPAAVYTSSALSVAHENPVEADASGYLPTMFLDPAVTYRFRLRDADGANVAGMDFDPVSAANAASIQFQQAGSSVIRTAEGKLSDIISVLDFIPEAEHAAILARTSTTDVAAYFQAAIDHIDGIGYGTLYIPSGRYRAASPVTLCNNLTLLGAGKASSHIQFTHQGSDVPSGSGFRLLNPSNGSTGAYVTLEKLWVEMTHASNTGAGFYDRASTFLTLRDCIFAGGKYGVIFDQTEVSGIYSCDMSGQIAGGAGLWLVNGPDITIGHIGGFTNQITVDHNCQFNHASTAYSVLDDGGECHFFGSNNINGGPMRFAGVSNLTILGGEYESVNGAPTMTFAATTLSGNAVGGCGVILTNGIITQPSGQPCIHIASSRVMKIERMQLTASGGGVAAHITGAANCGYIKAWGNANNNNPALPIFDGYASGGHDEDGLVPIFSTNSTGPTLSIQHYNAMLRTTAGSAVSLNVPADATLTFPTGTRIEVMQSGAGQVTIVPAGGVTVRSPGGLLSTASQYSRLVLEKLATNEWLLSGDLA